MSTSTGSVVFSRFYSGGSVCSPTRSSCLTGRTPTRECVINTEQNALPLQMNLTSTASYAKRSGYATGFFGKVMFILYIYHIYKCRVYKRYTLFN